MTADELDAWLQSQGVDPATREHRFHQSRRWRFDLCWPDLGLAVELHGMGRHIRPAGFIADRTKVNSAILMGWRVLEFTPAHWTQAERDKSLEIILRAMGWEFEELEE